jgi:hypothetical protein
MSDPLHRPIVFWLRDPTDHELRRVEIAWGVVLADIQKAGDLHVPMIPTSQVERVDT